MTFSLAPAQKAELQALRNSFPAVDAAGYSLSLNYYTMYEKVSSYIASWESAGNSLTLSELQTKVWLEGVREVNSGVGPQSDFIRNYNSKQAELRFGTPISATDLDKASDRIALRVIDRILTDEPLSVANFAGDDVATVSEQILRNDSAAWAGNPLLLFLGYSDPFYNNILHSDGDTYDLLSVFKVSNDIGGGFLNIIDGTTWNLVKTAGATALNALVAQTPINAYTASQNYLQSAYGVGLISAAYSTLFGNLILGTKGDDSAVTGSPNSILGVSFDEIINAGDGNDTIIGTFGSDINDGGHGTDLLTYSALSNNITVDLFNHAAQIAHTVTPDLQRVYNIENVTTGSGNDRIIGDDKANILTGGSGIDTLIGGSGNDQFVLATDGSIDTINDPEGGDRIVYDGNTVLGIGNNLDNGNYRLGNYALKKQGADLFITSKAGLTSGATIKNFFPINQPEITMRTYAA